MNIHSSGRACRRLVAGAAALAAVAALAACSGSSGIATNGASGAAGKNVDATLTIGSMFPPGTLDPTTGTQGSDYPYLNYVFDSLIQINGQTGALEPMLATSWKFVGADKLELDVSLRHGVKFQDGTPFNAQAVVDYSTAFIKAGDIANLLQYVTSVTASGPYEVAYHLSQQNAHLPNGLAGRAGLIPSPTAVTKEGKSFATEPVGAGPYKFVSEVQGASYKFTRFDGYWNDANKPRAKNVDFKVFQSDTSLVNAVRSGDVDAAYHLASQDAKTLKPISNLDVSVGPGTAVGIAYFNASRKPLTDARMRLAFNLALNRKAIMEAATDGLGQVSTQPLPPGTLGYVKSLDPVWPYDPTKAKALVKQAGYPNGTDMTCYEYPGLGYEIAGPIIIAEEKAVGINLKIIPGTASAVAPFFTNKAKPECYLANYTGGSDPFQAFGLLWSKSYYNSGKVDLGIDDFYNKFYETYTDSGQQQLAEQIEQVEATNPGYAIMFTAPLVNVYKSDVGGWVKTNLGIDNWQYLYLKS